MANLSSVDGEMTIQSTNTSLYDLSVFVYYFQQIESQYAYPTNLSVIEELDKDETWEFVKDYAVKETDESSAIQRSITFPFSANGRWSYQHNFKWFFDMKKYQDIIDKESHCGYDNLLKSITIKVSYTEEEAGAGFINESNATIIAKEIQPHKFESDVVEYHGKSYAYTIENLRAICGYEEACSIPDMLAHPEEYFTQKAIDDHYDKIKAQLERAIQQDHAAEDDICWEVETLLDDYGIQIDKADLL